MRPPLNDREPDRETREGYGALVPYGKASREILNFPVLRREK